MTEPFISRDDLAAYMNRTFDAGDDDLLAIVLDSSCEIIRSYIDQHVNYVADDEVLLNGTGTGSLQLPQLPVAEITTVTLIDGAVETIAVEGTDFVLDSSGIMWVIPTNSYLVAWPRGVANVKVKYTHGWDLTNNPTLAPPVPSDMRLVALQIAYRTWSGGQIPVGGLKSEAIGEYSYSLDTSSSSGSSSSITEEETYTLAKYKMVGVF